MQRLPCCGVNDPEHGTGALEDTNIALTLSLQVSTESPPGPQKDSDALQRNNPYNLTTKPRM